MTGSPQPDYKLLSARRLVAYVVSSSFWSTCRSVSYLHRTRCVSSCETHSKKNYSTRTRFLFLPPQPTRDTCSDTGPHVYPGVLSPTSSSAGPLGVDRTVRSKTGRLRRRQVSLERGGPPGRPTRNGSQRSRLVPGGPGGRLGRVLRG